MFISSNMLFFKYTKGLLEYEILQYIVLYPFIIRKINAYKIISSSFYKNTFVKEKQVNKKSYENETKNLSKIYMCAYYKL